MSGNMFLPPLSKKIKIPVRSQAKSRNIVLSTSLNTNVLVNKGIKILKEVGKTSEISDSILNHSIKYLSHGQYLMYF